MKRVLFIGLLVGLVAIFAFYSRRETATRPDFEPQSHKAHDSADRPADKQNDRQTDPNQDSVAQKVFTDFVHAKIRQSHSVAEIEMMIDSGWYRLARQIVQKNTLNPDSHRLKKLALALGDGEIFWKLKPQGSSAFAHWQENIPLVGAGEIAWNIFKSWPEEDLGSERLVLFLFEAAFRPHEIDALRLNADFARFFPTWLKSAPLGFSLPPLVTQLDVLRKVPLALLSQPSDRQRFAVAATLKKRGWPWPELAPYCPVPENLNAVAAQWWLEAGKPEVALEMLSPDFSGLAPTLEDAALAQGYITRGAQASKSLQRWFSRAQKSFSDWQEKVKAENEITFKPALPDVLAPACWWALFDSLLGENL